MRPQSAAAWHTPYLRACVTSRCRFEEHHISKGVIGAAGALSDSRRSADVTFSTSRRPQAARRLCPHLNVRPAPHVKAARRKDRGREVGVATTPLVNDLGALRPETLNDSPRVHQIIGIDEASHATRVARSGLCSNHESVGRTRQVPELILTHKSDRAFLGAMQHEPDLSSTREAIAVLRRSLSVLTWGGSALRRRSTIFR